MGYAVSNSESGITTLVAEINLYSNAGPVELLGARRGAFIPDHVWIETVDITGTVVTGPAICVGSNSSSYNNVAPSTIISILSAPEGKVYNMPLNAQNVVIDDETSVYVKRTATLIGLATKYMVRVYLTGAIIP